MAAIKAKNANVGLLFQPRRVAPYVARNTKSPFLVGVAPSLEDVATLLAVKIDAAPRYTLGSYTATLCVVASGMLYEARNIARMTRPE